jgi:hypothetical protein
VRAYVVNVFIFAKNIQQLLSYLRTKQIGIVASHELYRPLKAFVNGFRFAGRHKRSGLSNRIAPKKSEPIRGRVDFTIGSGQAAGHVDA